MGVHGNCMSGSLCAKDRRRHSFPFPHYGGNFLNLSRKFGGNFGNFFGIFFDFFFRNFFDFFLEEFFGMSGSLCAKDRRRHSFPFPHYGGNFLNLSKDYGHHFLC